ncbi:MG2 domain-containing protein [Hymenobacter psychrotolerans]|uniref:Macroglobulin domain-containing protein n=1 Tax=Hymenobacter psychrotolerans DSM 18569 TaxID=1121959 RepID=A0A1M6PEG5_9BACT|nr:MG2 domain-containing protein [Hymenobacter psychrotolerans]SHK06314.1 hypothetical protein SAMN02746009_00212 [Hymenobacter psychrotolerans DSM 18569]
MIRWTPSVAGSASIRFLLGLLLWLASAGTSLAQLDSLGGITGKLNRYERRGPQEKLFLHLDRPLYLSGETMWLKVYAVDGTYSRPLTLSSVAYVEVLDARRQPVLQGKVALKNATGQGSFVLPGTLASGTYTVRAYTSWMKNFSPDAYFQSVVTIVNTFAISGAPAAKDSAAADAQFFPEGGHLVKGLGSKVAFKVTDRTGKGVAAQGKVLNPQGAVVATFKTLRNGMGSFLLTPAVGGASPYTAVLTLSQGPTITRRLPAVQEQGYVLRLQPAEADQLVLTVEATGTQPQTLYLLVHSRQKTAIASQIQLLNGRAAVSLDRRKLLDGISHFTLFDASQRPLCERLYFQPPSRRLAIAARPDKAQYTARDKVSLQLATTDLQNQPLAANLSMAVYRLDSLNSGPTASIEHYLALSSELRGTIETPDYYFTAGPEASEAADNLMLTQGWSRFAWEEVLAATPKPFAYLPEPVGPVVRAQLTQAGTTTPRTGVITYLSSPSRIVRLSNSRSDEAGIVQFEMSNFYGPQDLMLQTDPQQDSTCRITLLSPFSTRFSAAVAPAFSLFPRFQSYYTSRHVQTQVQNVYYPQYRNRYLRQAADSIAFYGKPDESYQLDKYMRFKVMEEVLREYVPGIVVRIRKDGFHFLVVNKLNNSLFSENPMVLLDGVPVFNVNKIMAMDPLKIQKLDVIDGRYFHGVSMYSGLVSFTTYKGDLEGFQPDPRVLVQQYEGLQWQREFYSPRYETAQEKQSRLPDLRNLLYWNPEINTTAGTARALEFYTGDQAGRYLVVVQGLSATGLAGSTSFTVEVKPVL